jgi:hypothetical protein
MHATGVVGQALGDAVAHRRHQRVRRAEVDADRDAALMRVGRTTRFGDLQQAIRLLFQCVQTPIDVMDKAFDEHQDAHFLAARGKSRSIVEQRLEALQAQPADDPRPRRRAASSSAFELASSSASRHSSCWTRNPGGIAVLSSAEIGAPWSSHR